MFIRNSAKAIIVSNGKILLNKNENDLGDCFLEIPVGAFYYDLPGGGQNKYETVEDAVKRECLEETGYIVEIERLAAIYEEISVNPKFRESHPDYAHKMHFVFLCRLSDADHPKVATEKDKGFIESEWIDIEKVPNVLLYPPIVNKNLQQILKSEYPIYFGLTTWK